MKKRLGLLIVVALLSGCATSGYLRVESDIPAVAEWGHNMQVELLTGACPKGTARAEVQSESTIKSGGRVPKGINRTGHHVSYKCLPSTK